MNLDAQLKTLERIDRIKVALEQAFGATVDIEIGWSGESFEELRGRQRERRVSQLHREQHEAWLNRHNVKTLTKAEQKRRDEKLAADRQPSLLGGD